MFEKYIYLRFCEEAVLCLKKIPNINCTIDKFAKKKKTFYLTLTTANCPIKKPVQPHPLGY